MAFIFDPETGVLREEGNMPAATPIPQAGPGLIAQAVGGDPFTGRSFETPVGPAAAEFNQGTGEIDVTSTPRKSPEEVMALISQLRNQEAGRQGYVPGGAEMPAPEIPAAVPAPVESGPLPGATAEITKEGDPDPSGLTPERRAMLLRLMSGLTSAGRAMNAVPTLSDIQRGRAGRQFTPETALSGAAAGIEKEQKAKRLEAEGKATAMEEGKTDPLVRLYNETYAKPNGLPEVQTRQQAAQGMEAQQAGAGIEKTKAQTAAIKGKAGAAAEQQKLTEADMAAVAAGDLSRLSEDASELLQKKKDAFYNNSRINGLKTQIDAANSIKSRIDASESFGATSAFRAIARAAGEVGIMTDKDIKDFSERMGIQGLYDRAYKFGKSSLSPELREEIYKVAEAFTKDARNSLSKEVDSRVRDLTSTHSYLTEDAVRKFFVGDEESVAEEGTAESTGATIKGSDDNSYPAPAGAKVGDTFRLTPDGESISVVEVFD